MTATREIPVSMPPCRSPFYNDLGGEGDYYYNARWYDAGTGRFISEDPAMDGQNWYIYTSNNPIKYIDPTGMIFGLSSEESGEYDSDSKRPIERDDDDDDNDSKKPTFKERLQNFVKNAQAAHRKKKLEEALASLPKDVLQQLGELALYTIGIPADVLQAAGYGIAELDDLIPDYHSFTGLGLQEDLFAFGLFVGMNPSAYQNGINGFSYLGDQIKNGIFSSNKITLYNPMNKGPLADDIANTFRSSTYNGVTTNRPTTLYRVIGPNGNPEGSYWTRNIPNGPTQSIIDSALNPQWSNSATNVVRAIVPRGTTFYEGVASQQGGLVGGGNQIYIPQVNPDWIQGIVGF